MSNKKIIIISIITVVLLPLLIFLYIRFKDIYEVKKIEKEVYKVVKMIDSDNIDIEQIENNFKLNITYGYNSAVEKSIEEYLLDISKNMYELNKSIEYINSISILDNSNIEDLKKEKDKIDIVKNNLDSINENNYMSDKTNNKVIMHKYKSIISNKIIIDKYKNKTINASNNINILINVKQFLNENKSNYKVEDNKLIFLKRKVFEKYKELMNGIKDKKLSLPSYELIGDTTGPNIQANSVNLIVGTKYNFNDNVKCIDDVDGEVGCIIDGSYDTNIVGTYKMKISASDIAGNVSTREVTINIKEPPKPTGPYYTEVIRNKNTVIVYGLDDKGNYTKIVKVFPCSVGSGNNTPIGTFKTIKGYEWGSLFGNVYGQYSTRIVGSILFHSVPYFSKDKSTLWWQEYNKLGTARSMGCIRLTVRDAKWIYDNCPSGMTVKIYDGNLPSGVEKPSAPRIDGNSPNRGWDPTDPDPNNPWNK